MDKKQIEVFFSCFKKQASNLESLTSLELQLLSSEILNVIWKEKLPKVHDKKNCDMIIYVESKDTKILFYSGWDNHYERFRLDGSFGLRDFLEKTILEKNWKIYTFSDLEIEDIKYILNADNIEFKSFSRKEKAKMYIRQLSNFIENK